MFSSGWKIIAVLSTLLVFQLSQCDGKPEIIKRMETVSCAAWTKGYSNTMEDTFIQIENCAQSGIGVYAVFNGHDGTSSSQYSEGYVTALIRDQLKSFASNRTSDTELDAQKMLTEVIAATEFKLQKQIKRGSHISGTTCLIAIVETNRLTVANVGNSRAVLCKMSGQAEELSTDHIVNTKEMESIEKATEEISEDFIVLQKNKTPLLRCLGCKRLREEFDVIPIPEIRTYDFGLDAENRPSFMILASDGLWDQMSSQEAVNFIKNENMKPQYKEFGAPELVDIALNLGSSDNISVLTVVFNHGIYEAKPNQSSYALCKH